MNNPNQNPMNEQTPQGQMVHISLDPMNSDRQLTEYVCQDEFKVYFLPDMMMSGWPVVEVQAANVSFRLTARNFLSIAGAVRGKMIESGLIPVSLNPGMAIGQSPDGKLVHFCFEGPLQEFDYTTEEAVKMWREIKRIVEFI